MKKWKEKLRRFFKNKKNVYALILEVILIWSAVVLFRVSRETKVHGDYEEVLWSEFMEYAENGDIDTIYYDGDTSEWLEFTLLNDETRAMTRKERADYEYPEESWRKTLNPKTRDVGGLRATMLELGVNMRYKKNQEVLDALVGLAGLIVPIFWIILLGRLLAGQVKGFDQKDLIQKSEVKFKDVIGLDEILADLQFIVKMVEEPEIGERIGAKLPKGILFSGVPGTGKTKIAKAVAGEAGVPFITVAGSDFKEMYVGVGARRVRQLFDIARRNAPCILFIDEIDAIGASRSSKMMTTSEDGQTIDAMLKEMDGFTGRDGVFIIAATNHPEKLDSGLRRSGRFDREIVVPPPRDWKVRKQLFDYFLKDKHLSDDVNTEDFARQTVGFTGADIEMICNESAIVALMHDKLVIDRASLEEAVDKKVFNGNRSKSEQFLEDKRVVAYHEAGHAVMTYLCNEGLSRASIIGTTSGVGGAVFGADKETLFTTRDNMRHRIYIAFAGRISEEIKFASVTTGAGNDITQATQLMMKYMQEYGFDDSFGLVDVRVLRDQGLLDGDATQERISNMSRELYKAAKALLKANYDMVEALALKLLECETLNGSEIESLLGGYRILECDGDVLKQKDDTEET